MTTMRNQQRQRRRIRNPARKTEEVVAAVKRMLLDDEPGALEQVYDLLIENNMTLRGVSELIRAEDDGYRSSRTRHRGAFPVPGWTIRWAVNAPIKGIGGQITPVTAAIVAVSEHYPRSPTLLFPWDPTRRLHGIRRFDTLDEALRETVLMAWRLVVTFRQSVPADRPLVEQDAEILLQEARMVNFVLPPEVMGQEPEYHENPVGNPAWTTDVLARSFDTLASQVPPQWMPKLANVRRGPKDTLVARMKPYGCGMYGCVLPTSDPAVVLKVTTDVTEAEFATQLAADLVAPVCVEYLMAVSTSQQHQGRPIYLLWRESADDVGHLGRVLGEDAARAVNAQHQAATKAFIAFRREDPQVGALVEEWVATMAPLRDFPELEQLATGMLRIWNEQRIFFGDVHDGNLGRVFRGDAAGQWVVTDPGNVTVVR